MLGLVVVGIYAAEIQYINLGGNITFNVDDKSLYVQDVRIQEDMDASTTPYSLKQQGKFIPGYINGSFSMNLGTFINSYSGLMVYFDIINTMDENRNSFMYDVTASTSQTDGEIEVQAVVDNEEGYIPFGSITPSEITSTTSPTATVILTITSSQGVKVDLSQITITITRREPVEITGFTFSLSNTNHTASVAGYTGSDTTVTIPSSISVVETTDGETKYYEGSQYTVTSLGYQVFYNNTTITNVVFPDTLQAIGAEAFRNCYNLRLIDYRGTIDEWLSISKDYWIQTYHVNDVVQYTFTINGEEISEIEIPEGRQIIYMAEFRGMLNLTKITLPSSVTSIDYLAFKDCSNLSEINIPAGLETIGSGAFWSCTSLTSITIPSGLTSIEPNVFRSCTNLTNVTFEMAENEVWQVGNSNFSTIYAELTYSDLQDTANNAVLLKSTYYTRYWRKV